MFMDLDLDFDFDFDFLLTIFSGRGIEFLLSAANNENIWKYIESLIGPTKSSKTILHISQMECNWTN